MITNGRYGKLENVSRTDYRESRSPLSLHMYGDTASRYVLWRMHYFSREEGAYSLSSCAFVHKP